LHLQLIGFPIANDPWYGGELHFGESKARLEAVAHAKEQRQDTKSSESTVDYASPRGPEETDDSFMERTCTWCQIGQENAFNETQLHCSRIWLHALEYQVQAKRIHLYHIHSNHFD
jgi:hypothetical protein